MAVLLDHFAWPNAEVIPVRKELQAALSWALTTGVENGDFIKLEKEEQNKIPDGNVRRILLELTLCIYSLYMFRPLLNLAGVRRGLASVARQLCPAPLACSRATMFCCGLAACGVLPTVQSLGRGANDRWR